MCHCVDICVECFPPNDDRLLRFTNCAPGSAHYQSSFVCPPFEATVASMFAFISDKQFLMIDFGNRFAKRFRRFF